MSTFAEIMNAALTLPPHERDELAQVLQASIGGERQDRPRLSIGWQNELARRSAEVAAGTASLTTYEQMQERARRAAGHEA